MGSSLFPSCTVEVLALSQSSDRTTLRHFQIDICTLMYAHPVPGRAPTLPLSQFTDLRGDQLDQLGHPVDAGLRKQAMKMCPEDGLRDADDAGRSNTPSPCRDERVVAVTRA
jgi:hypothetical protein